MVDVDADVVGAQVNSTYSEVELNIFESYLLVKMKLIMLLRNLLIYTYSAH